MMPLILSDIFVYACMMRDIMDLSALCFGLGIVEEFHVFHMKKTWKHFMICCPIYVWKFCHNFHSSVIRYSDTQCCYDRTKT